MIDSRICLGQIRSPLRGALAGVQNALRFVERQFSRSRVSRIHKKSPRKAGFFMDMAHPA
ncbi:hypothetical protein QGM61_06525 [Pseudohongiella sp. SYSU M77423]|uniref:hypothetical protein n=1 Tax=Pseudohongiella sp. SYSU M77423 TaxID=3042312 RepID=UPI002480712E|nr:hypothetical protein [Pseudohongiella sp. SYSU M77423]MDH7943470.1 hypothetical protein [Pseudohongiella sp. SYSU M77423]